MTGGSPASSASRHIENVGIDRWERGRQRARVKAAVAAAIIDRHRDEYEALLGEELDMFTIGEPADAIVARAALSVGPRQDAGTGGRMTPEPITGEGLAAQYLALGERHKPPRCEVCGMPCSPDPDDPQARNVHPTCDPESL